MPGFRLRYTLQSLALVYVTCYWRHGMFLFMNWFYDPLTVSLLFLRLQTPLLTRF